MQYSSLTAAANLQHAETQEIQLRRNKVCQTQLRRRFERDRYNNPPVYLILFQSNRSLETMWSIATISACLAALANASASSEEPEQGLRRVHSQLITRKDLREQLISYQLNEAQNLNKQLMEELEAKDQELEQCKQLFVTDGMSARQAEALKRMIPEASPLNEDQSLYSEFGWTFPMAQPISVPRTFTDTGSLPTRRRNRGKNRHAGRATRSRPEHTRPNAY